MTLPPTPPAEATPPIAEATAPVADEASAPSTAPSSPAARSAAALLAELVRQGVTDIVLSPGSRSQPLALAAAALERTGAVALHVRVDERVAGFTALGLAVESGRPVVVVCTSGTAVANLHPAVLEAHHSGVALIVLTADRPAELRGIGSNQTTRQPGIFGEALRADWDVPAPDEHSTAAEAVELAELAVRASLDGPVHVNLAYREPLSGDPADIEPPAGLEPGPVPQASPPVEPVIAHVHPDDATVVIAGHGAGDDAERLAVALGAPLIAEVSSGARFGRHAVVAYRDVLRGPHGDAVGRAIVVGHPTLSREVPLLLERDDVETIVVRSRGAEPYNPGRRARIVDAVEVEGEPDAAVVRRWVGGWVAMSRAVLESQAPEDPAPDLDLAVSGERGVRAAFAKAELAVLRAPVDRGMLARALWASTWPHDRLVMAASRLIRVADAIVPGKAISVHANRGLAGIDGTVSTATGIAVAAARGGAKGTTRVLAGDLALVHDAGALLVPLQAEVAAGLRVHVFVGNDRGGTIFDALEVAETARADDYERVMRTPQAVDFAALAAAGGWAYRRVTTRAELDDALTAPEPLLLVEVPFDA